MNIPAADEDERTRLLLEIVDPLVHGELGDHVRTWFYFWEPALRLRIRSELDNLRAAVAWAAERAQADAAARLATALSAQIYFRQGWNVSALAETALTTPGVVNHPLYPLTLGCAADQAFRRAD